MHPVTCWSILALVADYFDLTSVFYCIYKLIIILENFKAFILIAIFVSPRLDRINQDKTEYAPLIRFQFYVNFTVTLSTLAFQATYNAKVCKIKDKCAFKLNVCGLIVKEPKVAVANKHSSESYVQCLTLISDILCFNILGEVDIETILNLFQLTFCLCIYY
jgi:hypothetical protein